MILPSPLPDVSEAKVVSAEEIRNALFRESRPSEGTGLGEKRARGSREKRIRAASPVRSALLLPQRPSRRRLRVNRGRVEDRHGRVALVDQQADFGAAEDDGLGA